MPLASLIACLVLSVLPPSDMQRPTTMLAGRVVVEGTGVPIADAHVVLVPMSRPTQPPAGPPKQTLTNEQGQYVFDDVLPGTYRVQARRAGFANPSPGAGTPTITIERSPPRTRCSFVPRSRSTCRPRTGD